MLTKLAKKKLDAAIAEACEAQFKLESIPSTTAELANFLTFLDEIKERVRQTNHSDVNKKFFLQYILIYPVFSFVPSSINQPINQSIFFSYSWHSTTL